MLRRDLAAKLLQHRENDIKIGLTGDDGEVHHIVTIDDVTYASGLDVILITGHRTFPEDVADDMHAQVRKLHERLAGTVAATLPWYVEWRQECADALGLSVDEL